MEYVFKDCHQLTSLDLSNFEVKATYMSGMFQNCYSLEYLKIPLISAESAYNLRGFFENCTSLKSIDLNSFTSISAVNIDNLFKNCYSLTSLDLSKFSTGKILSMSGIFENCGKLKSLDLSNFETTKANDMNRMFNNCSELEYLKLNFNTENVRDMQYMFASLVKLTSLDISTFNTTACTNFENMFLDDTDLHLTIDSRLCKSLLDKIPKYVNVTDLNDNL